MDGLIVLFIIMGIVSSLKKKKKKQEEQLKKYRLENAFAEAFPETAEEKKPQSAPVKKASAPAKPAVKVPEPVKKAAGTVMKAVEQEIPFTKEEWDKFLGSVEKKAAQKKPAEAKASAEGRISPRQHLPEGFSPALKSTQGESEEEHRRHIEKIAAEERLHQEKLETAHELRSMNRQKLRQAVIMSEVLGKPVALRGKRG